MVQQNETVADPDFGEYSGWIELYNNEEEAVDLEGWTISLNTLNGINENTDTLSQGRSIGPGEYKIIWTSGRGDSGSSVHTSFKLPESGGSIGLYGPEWADSPVIDTISYSAAEVGSDISMGRINFAGQSHPGFWLPMNQPTPGEENRLARLEQLNAFPLEISDPSGLGPDHSGNYLWTVSDDPGGSIYKITREGEIIEQLDVDGDDMEGIVQHPDNHMLWVAEERKREIVQFDTLGREIQRFPVNVEQQRENDGLEGITINPGNNHIFVVNKRLPRVLIELDVTRAFENQQIQYTPVNFRAGKEAGGLTLAGLYFEAGPDRLWIVSDEARAVFVLDLMGNPLAAFDADAHDLEAIALIPDEKRIYLVSDSDQILYEYAYPDPLRILNPRE